MVLVRAALLLFAIVLVACRPAAPDASLPPVTLPDLSDMEASVQQQITGQFDTVTRLARERAPADAQAPAYGTLGSLLFDARRANAAETAYLHAQALAPADARWPYYLGHIYMNRPDRPKAIAAFERTLQLEPGDVAALVWLGRVYLDAGQPVQAEARYTQALAAQPGTVAAMYGLGQAALAARDYTRAVEQFERVLAADPRASIAHYPLALAYRGLGDTAKAETHLRQQGKTEVGPPDPRMAELRGLLNSSAAEEARGIRAAEGGDYTAAVEHFRKGVDRAPDSISLRYNLGRALTLTGDAAGAMAAFEETIRRAPKDTGARLALGELLGRSGRFEEALTQYRAALDVDSRSADARFGYAGALVGLGRGKEALASLTESARLFPDQPRFTEARARVQAGLR
ncbi:MAG TPA: tetratricopeptide repeat protein [Vicinamibacterales bacterium]|nr:tetratricopeptide repeat protein [Vicinamibacterales bacterium]